MIPTEFGVYQGHTACKWGSGGGPGSWKCANKDLPEVNFQIFLVLVLLFFREVVYNIINT